MWMNLPTFDFNVYIFNVTNSAEVLEGRKPVLDQIGPYCYKEVKDKLNLQEDASTDTITYSARTTWTASQTDENCPSPHLTGDEVVVTPNVPLLATLMLAEKDFPLPFLILVNRVLPSIFGGTSDIFLRTTARSLLFDGILIDCSSAELLARSVCNSIKKNSRALKEIRRDVYSFSFFGAKNGTPEWFRYTVKRGVRNTEEVGRLVAIDGKPEMTFWRDACNQIQGTDSTVFPPFRLKENGSLVAYSSDICRVIFGVYEGTYDYKGVQGYAFSATFGNTDLNPGDRCFCPTDDRCYKKGTLDAFKCQGAPLVTSLPHFYQASSDYVTGVQGLRPDKDKHGISIVLEPTSGVPLLVKKRLQMNIDLRPFAFTPNSQNLERTLVPLFWAEELLELDEELMNQLDSSLFLPERLSRAATWTSIATGSCLMLLAAVLKLRRYRQDRVHDIGEDAGRDDGYEEDWRNRVKYKLPRAGLQDTIPSAILNIRPYQQNMSAGYRKPIKEVMAGLSAADLMKNVSKLSSDFQRISTHRHR
ncbi:sensory neuron membrane protein 1-like [Homalodisca vitripennis]|uniref:sensory neuron membrane protein 1-like n=1 Tax=Homalodisca vitripennis TaxID=197043 RepID=UPI001EEAFB62|nr:sensory neuron membrane protein 1-like [Homalodisca vitripennis]